MFKPHHLELFYYVARYGGISAATRHIPYGIGQPAISGQISDLERLLGRRLFERKPFKLTEEGRKLYDHVAPFFDGLPPLWDQLRHGLLGTVRIAVDEMLGPRLLPLALPAVADRMPGFCIELVTGPYASPEGWLRERKAHVVIAAAGRRIPGVRALVVASVAPCLLVRRKAKIDSAGYFWQQGRVAERLIAMESGTVYRTFERGLRAMRVQWPVSFRVDSSEVMHEMVAGGLGVGIDVDLPESRQHPEVRVIRLTGFGTIPLGIYWHPAAKPLVAPIAAAVQEIAGKWWPAERRP